MNRRLSFEIEGPDLESLLELSHAAQLDGMEYLSDGPINIPEDSVIDTESSDGQAHNLEDEMDDGDHEKDHDYVMNESSDSSDSDDLEEFNVDIHQEAMGAIGKTKKVCFSLLLLLFIGPYIT